MGIRMRKQPYTLSSWMFMARTPNRSIHTSDAETLISRLEFWSTQTPHSTALDFRPRRQGASFTLTFEELSNWVRALAEHITYHVPVGERALILFPSNREYVVALLACMYAGVIGVPVNLPGNSRVPRVLKRISPIARDCTPTLILTSSAIIEESGSALNDFAHQINARVLAIDSYRTQTSEWMPGALSDIAYLQYTSGSTGDPKGVINAHDNLIANIGFIQSRLLTSPASTCVNWLPLFHDMGLIMGVLTPLAFGGRAILLTPGTFVLDPLHWLEVAAQEKGTLLPCASFAMDMCVEKYDAGRCADWDLSSIESFVPAAEPVLPRQVQTFYEIFSQHGLKWESIRPVYGLAEASLLISISSTPQGPMSVTVDTHALETGRVVEASPDTPGSRTYISNGADFDGQEVRCVNPVSRTPVPEEQVGEIWASGPQIAKGYWNKKQATESTFHARLSDGSDSHFLRTGDLGFIKNGHLYITGRLKDTIIIRGENHYPNDIEESVTGLDPSIVTGSGVAFSVPWEDGHEHVVLVQEVRRMRGFKGDHVQNLIRDAIGKNHGLALKDVVLIRKGTLKRTTSGKVQRSEMRRAYLAGELVNLALTPAPEDLRAHALSLPSLQKNVTSIISTLLGEKGEGLDPHTSVFSLGCDSLKATKATALLEKTLGLTLPEGLLFDYPTVTSLTAYLKTCLPMREQPDPEESPKKQHKNEEVQEYRPPSLAQNTPDEPIAIIGIGCRLPGGDQDITTPQAFWQWLYQGGDAIRPMTENRFALDPHVPGFAAALQHIDGFDAAFFNIGPREAIYLDPQQRLLLETTWHALEDAHILPSSLRGTKTGVFMGVGSYDYSHLPFISGNREHLDPYYATGTSSAGVAGRLSFFFDWHGPSIAFDTACSASHTAIHSACQALRYGECSLAVAGGVKLQILTEYDLVLARAGMLSPDGKCKTFDASADGYGRGEGVGVLILKPLTQALRDGDPIRAVIVHSALAHDGASANLSAPNVHAQERLIRDTLEHASWTPNDVDYNELHGTGTRLGDPIEYNALKRVFSGRDTDSPLFIGSVKTNVGHLEAAAGVVGVIKTVLALEEGTIPPHLHFHTPNPNIPLEDIPAQLPCTPIPWPVRNRPRRAGVTSCGFTGSIGYILLEQAPPTPVTKNPQSRSSLHLFISGKSQASVEHLREAYLSCLEIPEIDANALCTGASLYREHLSPYHLMATGKDAASLGQSLKMAPILDIRVTEEATRPFMAKAVRSSSSRMRHGLPLYPFDHQRFWLGDAKPQLASHDPSQPSLEPFMSLSQNIRTFVYQTLETVLCVDRTHLKDTVFLATLGMDSIKIMDLARIVHRDFGVTCSLRRLFENSTPKKLIAYLEDLITNSKKESEILEPITADLAHRHDSFPLTELQYAYWIGRDPIYVMGNISCHVYFETETETHLSLPQLEKAWNVLVERHDALRLIFDSNGTQRILPQVPTYTLREMDLSGGDETEVHGHVERVRNEMSHHMFNPGVWPLFDIRISRLPGGRDRIHLSLDVLINDALSTQILLTEWHKLYEAETPEIAGLPPLRISFRDYVVAKTNPIGALKTQWDRDRAYWMEHIPTLPLAPQLPLACSPESIKKPKFVRHTSCLPAALWERLKSKAHSLGVTPSALLMGLFGEVLSRWSEERRFCLNVTIFDRAALHEDINHLVGDFTCLMLLSLDYERSLPLADRLRQVQDRLFDVLEHRSFSAVDVLRECNRGLEPGQQRIMPVVFTSTLGIPDFFEKASKTLGKPVYGISQTPQVWLDHQIFEEKGSLIFNWDTVDGLFPKAVIEDMFQAYEDLLSYAANASTDWDAPIRSLCPTAHEEVRAKINSTEHPLELFPLHALFFQSAARTPKNVALITSETSWTYGALSDWVQRLSTLLLSAGLKKGDRVGVIMEKGPEQAAACLAILSQGGVYVPVDPHTPQARCAKIQEGSAIGLWLTQESLLDTIPDVSGEILVADHKACEDIEPTAPLAEVHLDDDAYVIYTSGSTGTPKGVLISHRGATNTIVDINERFSVTEMDRVLAFSALNFDLSVYDLFGLLAAGGAIVFPSRDKTHDPSHWGGLVDEHHVTLWNSVPAVCDLLLREKSCTLSSIRLVLLSGDWVPLKLPDILKNRTPQARLIVMGGATEASIWSNWFEVTHVDPHWRSIPYGFPLSNQAYHVLDSHLNPCPNWVKGDLYIAGTGLALGYEGDPVATKHAFILSQKGERLYKTGDMARYWPDGTLEFLGRKDTQVKIAGHRIELGEIEAALLTHPHIQEAAVESTGEIGAQRLIGWLKLTEGATLFHVKNSGDPKEIQAQDHLFENGKSVSLTSLHVPDHKLRILAQLEEELATTCLRHIFRSAGLFTGKDAGQTEQALAEALGFQGEFRCLLPRWLAHLERVGDVSHENSLWHGSLPPPEWESLQNRIQDLDAELADASISFLTHMKDTILPHIIPMVRKDIDPLQLFYSPESSLTPNALSRLHPCMTRLQRDLGRLISEVSRAARRPLRVLDVGSRLESDTQEWLQEAASSLQHLILSDPSPLLLEKVGQSVAKDYPDLSLETWVFDPDTTRVEESRKGSCDLILALSGFHRCKDLPKALAACSSLLTAGGSIIFVEFTQTSPLLNLTTALIERGYESLADFRQGRGTPLLTSTEWTSVLSESGFTHIQSYEADQVSDIHLFRARISDTVHQFAQEKVCSYLEGHLPDYMIPRHFMVLEDFPLSANGKVDRKRLPKPNFMISGPQTSPAGFQTQTEEKMAALWSQFLPNQIIDRQSNFFTAGGDSLTAVRMVETLRNTFQKPVTLRDIFAHPLLAALAQHMDQKSSQETNTPSVPIALEVSSERRFEPFPLTDVQQAYWVGHQPIFPLSGVSAHYYFELDVTGHTLSGLNAAWNRLIIRHEMLRAVIDSHGQQRILPHVPTLAFPSVDLSSSDESALDFWLTCQRKEMDHKIYDTTAWPLFDIRAAQLQDRIRLLISLDTVICDARSVMMLLSEWSLLSRHPETELPPLELSFRDMVLHWKKEESSQAFYQSLNYWRNKLPELPSGPQLPLITAPEDVSPVRFKRQEDILAPEMWSAFRDQVARHGLSLNAVLMTAYSLCLRAGGGGDFFSLNLTLFRRDAVHPQANFLVGDFTSLLLLPFDGRAQGSFHSIAQRLQLCLGEGLDHTRVSAIRVMQEAFTQKQNLTAPVVFTSNLGVDRTASDGHTQDWLGTFVGGLTQTPQVWLDLQVVERDNALLIYWDYVHDLFEPTWIQNLCKAYHALLQRLAGKSESWEAPWDTLVEPLPLPDHIWNASPEVITSEQNMASQSLSNPQIEALISQALSSELHHGPLDPQRNFFELGATSLSLIRLHQTLKETLGITFPVTALFEHTSIHALSAHLSMRMAGTTGQNMDSTSLRKTGGSITAQRRRALRAS